MGRPLWLTLYVPVICYFHCSIKMWYCDDDDLFSSSNFNLLDASSLFHRFVCGLVKIVAIVLNKLCTEHCF